MTWQLPGFRPVDERRHDSTGEDGWVEAWLFDLVQVDASVAASIELLRWPDRSRAAFHVSIVRAEADLISLVEADAQIPTAPGLELRAPGLWTDIGIQTPFDHVTVDIEAFAVELDDPADVFTGAFGVRVPIGSELEWETAAEPQHGPTPTSYEIPCIVHGELLLGDAVLEIDGWGWRSHRWGVATPTDRSYRRGRRADQSWLLDPLPPGAGQSPDGLQAPVPDPSLGGARLEQRFVHGAQGDVSWIRTCRDHGPNPSSRRLP